jgi:hypothetical protein
MGRRLLFERRLGSMVQNQKDMSPLVFKISKRKKWNVNQALNDDAWNSNVNMEADFTMDHIR